MAANAIHMEQLKQVLQLKRVGFSIKAIARYDNSRTSASSIQKTYLYSL